MNCKNCNESLPTIEKLYFCPNCSSQVKCKNCDEQLLPTSKFCSNCGNSVKKVNNDLAQGIMNEFDYEEKGNAKKVRARFTNEIGTPIAETFAAIMGMNAISKKQFNPFLNKTNTISTDKVLVDKPKQSKNIIEEADLVFDTNYQNVLTDLFDLESEKLRLINPRLKQTGKLDNAIRLSILTLFAYEIVGKSEIDRSLLTEMLNSSKLEDSHFKNWIAKCDEILNENNKLKLSVPGREVAKAILDEVSNESIVKGEISFSKISSRGKRKKKKDNNNNNNNNNEKAETQQTSPSNRKSKGPIFYLESLIKEGYFDQCRKINDISNFLKDQKGIKYESRELSTPLNRMIRLLKLKRDKNSDSQYEYIKP